MQTLAYYYIVCKGIKNDERKLGSDTLQSFKTMWLLETPELDVVEKIILHRLHDRDAHDIDNHGISRFIGRL